MASAGQVTITTTATLIIDIGTTFREVHIHGAQGAFYIGGDNVTASTGFKIDNGEKVTFQMTPTEKMYGITSSGSSTCGFFISAR
jgi:hypothetical protein